MGLDDKRLEMIRANAAFAIKELGALSEIDFGLDAASVAWTEGFIERQRAALRAEGTDGIVNVLGSYLGEAIIAAVPGASWEVDANGTPGILFPTGDMAFPFGKVAKQFADGLESGESILSFYNISVKYVAAGKLGKAKEGEAP
jgi:hypothetical protein